jgi:Asp-tRNA(Asn)/Glu-tRNA(Gln) amidotransferase B subunit
MSSTKTDSMVDRRKSPDYRQLSGHIPKEMYREFKSFCALKDVSQSEAMEEAIAFWMERQREARADRINQ